MVIKMDKLQEFKSFIKTKPDVLDKIHNNEITWQQVYETYDLYGSNHSLFGATEEKEVKNETKSEEKTPFKTRSEYVNNALKMFQDVDMDKVTSNLQSIQKVMGIFGEITKGVGKDNQSITDIKNRRYKRYND